MTWCIICHPSVQYYSNIFCSPTLLPFNFVLKSRKLSSTNIIPCCQCLNLITMNFILLFFFTFAGTSRLRYAFVGSKVEIPCYDNFQTPLPIKATDSIQYKWQKGKKVITGEFWRHFYRVSQKVLLFNAQRAFHKMGFTI